MSHRPVLKEINSIDILVSGLILFSHNRTFEQKTSAEYITPTAEADELAQRKRKPILIAINSILI